MLGGRGRQAQGGAGAQDPALLPLTVMANYLATHGPITVTINMKLLQVG